jgi:CheY-like chemotaxis protein
VEDEDALRAGTARVLAERGYDVLTAVDAMGALKLLAEQADPPVALVLTDVVMPRMRGDELARQIADERPGLPVLLMSGYAPDPAPEGFRCLTKPVPTEELLQAIREALDG